MTLVLLRHHDAVLVRDANVWRRARARILGRRLDEDLARGVSPDTSIDHSLRASLLAAPGQRLMTATAVNRVLDEAVNPAGPAVRVPQPMSRITRAVVAANAYELCRVAGRLASAQPVSSRGLALARLLATDGAGPLHNATDREVLRRACVEILEALEPEDDHS